MFDNMLQVEELSAELIESSGAADIPLPINEHGPIASNKQNRDQLSVRLTRLLDQRLNYVILTGHEQLPIRFTTPIILLYEVDQNSVNTNSQALLGVNGQERALVNILELDVIARESGTYWLTAGKFKQVITLVPKGAGFFPEGFESKLLRNRMQHNQVVAIPEPQLHLQALLFFKAHRTDWLKLESNTFKQLLMSFIDRVVGPPLVCDIPQYSRLLG